MNTYQLRITTAIISANFLAAGSPMAQDKAAGFKQTAYRTSVSQEQMRVASRRLKGEMSELLEEFGQYQSASVELATLKEVLGQLDVVTERDMAEVVKILREASQMEKPTEAASKLVAASGSQKEIQASLRAVADRLALRKDEASIQQRLDQLALRQLANLRATKVLADFGGKPDQVVRHLKEIQAVNKAEQTALQEEIRMVMNTLNNLAEKTDPVAKEAFEAALKSGWRNKIETIAKEATTRLSSDFAEAAKNQEQVVTALKEMVEAVGSRKPDEELARDLAERTKELARKEKQLATAATSAQQEERDEIRKEQEAISDQIQMTENALSKLNPEADSEANNARQEADAIASKLKTKEGFDSNDDVAKTADAQNSLAEKLESISISLENQADAMAAASQPEGGSPENSTMSSAEAAIADAVEQVMDAKNQMALAERQMHGEGDKQSARQRLEKAQNSINQARGKLGQAEGSVPEEVLKELERLSNNSGSAAASLAKQNVQEAKAATDRGQHNANQAIDGLQKAANSLAAKNLANSQKKASKPSKSGGKGKEGGEGKDGGPSSDVTAVSDSQGGRREALSLLQQEKAPPKYEESVRQYIRNLAEGAEP